VTLGFCRSSLVCARVLSFAACAACTSARPVAHPPESTPAASATPLPEGGLRRRTVAANGWQQAVYVALEFEPHAVAAILRERSEIDVLAIETGFGRAGDASRARERAGRATAFLSDRGVAPARLRIADGCTGYPNHLALAPDHIELWIVEEGGSVLTPHEPFSVDFARARELEGLDGAESARKAMLAGIDYEIGTPFLGLVGEVEAQRAPASRIDEAVEHTLSAKFELGLFDERPLDPARAAQLNNAKAHQKLALEAARQAAVLLKNDNLLPLDRGKLRRIAVVGPNAARAHLGGYSADPGRGVSLLDGVRAAAGKAIEVRYARGCNITSEDLTWDSRPSTSGRRAARQWPSSSSATWHPRATYPSPGPKTSDSCPSIITRSPPRAAITCSPRRSPSFPSAGASPTRPSNTPTCACNPRASPPARAPSSA